MNTPAKKITVLIPCYNEAESITEVIENFPLKRIKHGGYELEIVVIDNNSSDNTAEIAQSLGVTVVSESNPGKGNAIRRGFDYALTNGSTYVAMLDGDFTYAPEELLRLVEPLDSGFCSVVIGSRLAGNITPGSMKTFNRFGNWMYSHLVRYFYKMNVTDVLSGYFAWKIDAVRHLRPHLISSGFAIEMEMVTKMAKLGEQIYCVPISYNVRGGVSSLRPIYDGSRILLMFAQNLFWKPQVQTEKGIAFNKEYSLMKNE